VRCLRTVLAFNRRELFIVVLSYMQMAFVLESYVLCRSLDCSISLATGYGLDDREKDFCLLHSVQTDSEAHPNSYKVQRGLILRG
jgi:hypothetical protein